MSHRGLIAVRQQDGQYRLTHLHSCSYPATVWGDIAAGEILLSHHNSYAQALALSALPEIGQPSPYLAAMLPTLNRPPIRPLPLYRCLDQAEADIYIEDLYIHDGREWLYRKPRSGQPTGPLREAAARQRIIEWETFDRNNPHTALFPAQGKSRKTGQKPRRRLTAGNNITKTTPAPAARSRHAHHPV